MFTAQTSATASRVSASRELAVPWTGCSAAERIVRLTLSARPTSQICEVVAISG